MLFGSHNACFHPLYNFYTYPWCIFFALLAMTNFYLGSKKFCFFQVKMEEQMAVQLPWWRDPGENFDKWFLHS